jgi:hypothetical protein
MALTEDLSVFLADFGVSVSFSGSTAGMLGIVDAPGLTTLGDDEGRARLVATERTCLIRSDQRGSLKAGSSVTVDGTAYVVREALPYEDGAFTLLALRNA